VPSNPLLFLYSPLQAVKKNQMKIYLIPGLGYDYRIFEKMDLDEFETEYIDWIEPEYGENLHCYSKRLFSGIETDKEKIILIGHSLGGIVAQEIATVKNIDKIILISSIKSRKELPFHFRIIKPFFIYKLFTKTLILKTFKIWAKSHGFETRKEKELFKSMISGQSNKYLNWALKELSSWKTSKISFKTQIFQIHGNKDKTFPIVLINEPDFTVENGGHFMVYKQSQKISKILVNEIKNGW
jgi:pimeloyl-ACP methyl ester carboxylesterase